MRIASLTAYPIGYTGFVEESDQYVLFLYPLRGAFRPLQAYQKADFNSYDHFVSVIGKLTGRRAFLHDPIPVETMSFAELERIRHLMSKKRERNLK